MPEQPWSIWAQLAMNLMAVAFFISVWVHLQPYFIKQRRRIRHTAFGLTLGLGAVGSMLLAVRLNPGVIFDFRSPLVALAGFFGGPIGGTVAACLAGGYRAWVGGPGMTAGLISIVLNSGIGAAGYLLTGRVGRPWEIALLALGVGVVGVVSFLVLPGHTLEEALRTVMGPVVLLSVLATFVAGMAILQTRRMAAERHLLRAAIAQAPDFLYVKNTDSDFVAVNNQVAQHHGFGRPEDMVGKSDRDITNAARAGVLRAQEQQLLDNGESILNLEEHLTEGGDDKWFVTSKVPVRDEDGTVIGIAGATRDITQSRKLERDLVDSRNLLAFAMSEMADGLAMFDREGFLIYSNERYRSAFPLTAEYRKEGSHIREILSEVVRLGEQVNLQTENAEEWIDAVEASLQTGGEEQVNLYDGRWLHLRTRVTESGASMVVVSDVTTIKQSEGKLRLLATTDGLTGLTNRRAFDEKLAEQVAKTAASGADLSLLMIDVDHFKSYNDTYGHPAGDECLRVVSACLKLALRRADDVVARYGGEEFVAILPGTSDDDAYQVAERIRGSIVGLCLPHQASPKRVLTASIGVATYAGAGARSAPQLIARADEALYEAKAAGRNRTMGWQPRHKHRSLAS